MKKTKRILAVLMALVMCLTVVVALVACNKWDCDKSGHKWINDDEKGIICSECGRSQPSYTDEQYREIYDKVFSEFTAAYAKVKDAKSTSERYVLQAIAEAKLLEANAFSFTNANGGNYAISRVAPHTITDILYGSDRDRLHQALVAKTFIKAADRNALIEAWNKMKKGINPDTDAAAELKGSDYNAWAKAYLESHGYEIKDVYNMAYGTDVKTWDVLATSEQTDSEVLVNTYDGLVEYDELGILQPALAESWSVSEDGLTYTFKIREGLVWTNSQGEKVADLTAKDFVTGMQHMLDAKGGLEYIIEGVIAGAHEYLSDPQKDFSKVGVKATDDHTLVYTLEAETPYFLTMFGYSIFAPLSESFFKSKGGVLGAGYQAAAADESYVYGKTFNDIAYCGPYTVTSYTKENATVLSANPLYWNKDGINLKTINRKYDSGKVATSTYENAKSGVIDGAILNTTTLTSAKSDKLSGDDKSIFELYAYISGVDSTAFMVAYNLARVSYTNYNDTSVMASTQNNAQMERAHKAMLNQNFRQALTHAFDRVAYRTARVGADVAATSLVNTYTPGNYVSLTEEVTVKINGQDRTFAAGTLYGAIIQAQLDADNAGFTVWKEVDGEWKSYGFDGWYNLEKAVEKMSAAIAELAEEGVEISAENPIVLDVPNGEFNDGFNAQGQSYKKTIEEAFGGKVIINLVNAGKQDDLSYATYWTNMGTDHNYDVSTGWTGWGPDFGDPCTFLDTMLPDGAGYMTKLLGLW